MIMGLVTFILGFYFFWCSTAKGEDIGLSGYRTPSSEESPKNWKASNVLMGYLFIIEGIVLFIVSLVNVLEFWPSFIIWIGFVVLDIILVESVLYFYSKKQKL